MDFPIKVAVKGKGVEILNKQTYIAAGGQGTVCQKGGTAFKIYHDPAKMIPVGKIQELQCLTALSNVLGPQDILLDPTSNKPMGFTMRYIQKTEFLCRLFNKNFKQDNGISPNKVVEMVKIMQKTLSDIHKSQILVVDLNEMNFLTSEKFDEVYFIDVDSYQTPSFKANALMESVRDRTTPKGVFSQGSDWFSFAVVTFQLYMGYHPYRKGKHPKYAPKDWSERMDENISIFHKDIQLDDTWKTWNLIPKPHLEWYKRVFDKKERSIPPLPDGVMPVAMIQPLLIGGTASFDVSQVLELKEKILNVYSFGGLQYAVTASGVYSGTIQMFRRPKTASKMSLAQVVGDDPIVILLNGTSEVIFQEFGGVEVGKIAAVEAMHYEGRIYTVYNGKMTESTFQEGHGKVLHLMKEVASVFEPATKLYPGVAVQDILGTCWMAIPYAVGACSNTRVKELDHHRIIDAKYENGICIVISELESKYFRTVLCFGAKATTYTCRQDVDIDDTTLNFTVLKNGVCIHIPTDDKIEVFKDNAKIRSIDKPPFTVDMKLVNDAISVQFINQTRLYNVRVK